jgi:hypothetical protein
MMNALIAAALWSIVLSSVPAAKAVYVRARRNDNKRSPR